MGVKVIDVIYDSRLRSIAQPDFRQAGTDLAVKSSSSHPKELWHIFLSIESWLHVNDVGIFCKITRVN
jgi:hypothetical protein